MKVKVEIEWDEKRFDIDVVDIKNTLFNAFPSNPFVITEIKQEPQPIAEFCEWKLSEIETQKSCGKIYGTGCGFLQKLEQYSDISDCSNCGKKIKEVK